MKRLILIYTLILLIPTAALAQGNGFNFQGRLNDGTNPANGNYDLQFKLFNAATGGTQIGATVARPATTLINGVFSVNLDFGASAFNNPNSIFIEIAVKPAASPNDYTILGPRQQLTVVPFAVRATNATNADNATNAVNANRANSAGSADIATFAYDATNATNATNAVTSNDALKLGGLAPSGYVLLNSNNDGNLRVGNGFPLTGELFIYGNAKQSFGNSYGFVKAMVHVGRDGSIISCYNGFPNAESPCGITVTIPLPGVYRINIGTLVTNRFVSITPEYATTCNTLPIACRNAGANFRFFGTNSIEVFTFDTDNKQDTTPASFMLIVY